MNGTIGEIRLFAGNFAPKNWALCQGQTLSIASNTALFSILGVTYGGNGQSTFALPDFRSRVAVGFGQGPGLSPYSLGETGGAETFTITNATFPAHTHVVGGTVAMQASAADGDADGPQNTYPAALSGTNMYATANNGSTMANMQLSLTAANAGAPSPAPVSITQPVLGLNFVICIYGEFPSRN